MTLAQLLVTTDDQTLVQQLCKTKWSNPERRQELIDLLADSIDRDRNFAAEVDQLAADLDEVKAKRQKKAVEAPALKRRGRPPGVKNKAKPATVTVGMH